MTLDLLHADAVTDDGEPVGLVTTGGTGQHPARHARLPRAGATPRGITAARTSIKPETAHPAFDKALPPASASSCAGAGRSRDDAQVDVDWVADHIDDNTIAIVGSAVQLRLRHHRPDRGARRDLALERGVGLHVDGCLGGFILPFGEELGYDIPLVRLPRARRHEISADTHKYGYALKGTSVLLFRDKALRNGQYFFHAPLDAAASTCRPASRARAPAACSPPRGRRWCSLGREGYRATPSRSSRPPTRCRTRSRSHPELRIMGDRRRSASASPVRRVRHLPRQRLHADRRAGASTASSTRRDPHGRHPAADADPASSKPSRPTSPRPSPTRSEQRRRGVAAVRRDLRRRARWARPDRRSRRLHRSW